MYRFSYSELIRVKKSIFWPTVTCKAALTTVGMPLGIDPLWFYCVVKLVCRESSCASQFDLQIRACSMHLLESAWTPKAGLVRLKFGRFYWYVKNALKGWKLDTFVWVLFSSLLLTPEFINTHVSICASNKLRLYCGFVWSGDIRMKLVLSLY